VTSGLRGRGRRLTPAIVGVCALVAAGLDGLQLSRPGYLLGSTADISVYLGSAVRLVHGAAPYRDFVLVQPPGITLLLSPAALLSALTGTRWALAAVRLATILLAAANVVLVGRLVRQRGPLPSLAACGVMAVYPAELYALNNGLLEPLVDFFCLVGATLVFEDGTRSLSARRWLLGGVAMGFAATVKLPAVIPALALAAVSLPDLRHRLLPYVAGGVAGSAIPAAGFFAAAPGSFVRDVVLSQAARIPSSGRAPLADRLAGMTVPGGGTTAVALTAVLAGVIVLGLAVRGRSPGPVGWFAIGSLLAVAAVQFLPAQWYPQYAALLAPFLAVTVGVAVDGLAMRIPRPSSVMVAVAVLLAAILGARIASVEGSSVPDPVAAVDAVVPPGGCAMSDGPTLLVPSNRLVPAGPGCTEMVDPFGTMLSYSGDPSGGVPVFRAAITHADYLVLGRTVEAWLGGPYSGLRGYVAADFRLVRSGGLWIYVRDGYPVG